ncbi:MAG TPA: primosomal protein N' [Bacteroidetes bacterium]|nr:primosomal protein N' [Bacteroidota bacterium]
MTELFHTVPITGHFADIILPLAVPKPYTYSVPEELLDGVQVGMRVEVQFGGNKRYAGLVLKTHQQQPEHKVRPIVSIIDEQPILDERTLKFWQWLASYYACPLGAVMDAALPANLKLASERRLMLSPLYDDNFIGLDDKEYLIAEALSIQETISIDDVRKILNLKSVFHIIKRLLDKKVIYLYEEMPEKYKPKKIACVRLAEPYRSDRKMLQEAFEKCSRALRQTEALLAFVQADREQEYVRRQDIYKKAKAGSTVLKAMEKKGIFELYEREVSRLGGYEEELAEAHELSEQQVRALSEIHSHFTEKNVVLLHGVTGSGKTRVYIELIKEAIERGEQVLYLLPEVALTTQIISRLQKIFGDQVGVYHHRITNNERVELWKSVFSLQSSVHSPQSDSRQSGSPQSAVRSPQSAVRSPQSAGHSPQSAVHSPQSGSPQSPAAGTTGMQTGDCGLKDCRLKNCGLVLGARSGLFLPFSNLGLVIVDEEHDTSYKQHDPAPRYHGRDAAIYLAHLHGAKTLLGTATPSIETYQNAKRGKYGLVEMPERFGGIELPETVIVDAKQEMKERKLQSHFTSVLLDELKAALGRGEQAILFQNRRGHSPTLRCTTCAWHAECVHCDVSLTYHKYRNNLLCHYCGFTQPLANKCPACGSIELKLHGFGTQKIEDELKIYLPDAKIGRMDYDAVRTKDAHARIINDFEEKRLDILVGTQMVTKGLDFDNVSIVGVLSADSLLQFPDFRSGERGFQMITQVAGRAGRKSKPQGGGRGKVIVQAMNTAHPVLREILDNDFRAFFEREIMERSAFMYPPFSRLIKITLKHKKPDVVNRGGQAFVKVLRSKLDKRVLGPSVPPVGRVRSYYLLDILIKMEMNPKLWKFAKDTIADATQYMQKEAGFSTVRVNVDVDPV